MRVQHGRPERRAASASGALAAQMRRVKGAAAIEQLKSEMADSPVVLLTGMQCTGKGKVAPLIAEALAGKDGVLSGTGKLMRAAAQQAGKDVETFVQSVPADFDVQLDFAGAAMVARGEVDVFEGRLAGNLGAMLRELGRANLVSVCLTASPREQALRYVAREVGDDARARVEAAAHIPAGASMKQALSIAAQCDARVAEKLGGLIAAVDARDENDRRRLMSLYGVDFTDTRAFDVVIHTDGKTPAQVAAEVMRAVKGRLRSG